MGDRAVEAARQSDLFKSVIKTINEATRYTEGTGIRLMVKATKDLAPIRKLDRNQSNCVLFGFVQGRHSLHPNDEDLSLGTPALMVAPT